MKIMKKYFVFMAAIAVVFFVSSCAKAPVAEMNAAKTALEEAKAAQAEIFLEAEFTALQDSVNKAATEIQNQKSKVFGNYKHAAQMLNNVTTEAGSLAAKTEVRKLEVKNEIVAAQNEIVSLMEENNKLVELAPKGKEGKEAIESIKSDLSSINTSASEIQALIDSNEIIAAQSKANAVKQKAASINSELKTVLEKYMRKA